jgi:hypothetical protein
MNEKQNKEKSGGIFRTFEFLTEAVGWLQIVASPFLLGLILGAIIYFTNPNTMRLIIGIVVALAGLLSGILLANKQWKGNGTISFMSRIMATPELDKQLQKNDDDMKMNDNQKSKA